MRYSFSGQADLIMTDIFNFSTKEFALLKKSIFVIFLIILLAGTNLYAHCQIPCGIFDDELRFTELEEHITTIEKSMTMITQLSAENPPNWNQIVRWVDNKEDHAGKFSEIISDYFLAQRIKPVNDEDKMKKEKYFRQLSLVHELIVYAMKTKQTTDLEQVKKLRSLLADFKAAYSN